MINVEVEYYTKKNGNNVYTKVEVVGHANDGTLKSIKCCACVTSILLGFIHIVDEQMSYTKIDKGYFIYRLYDNKRVCSIDNNSMHCVISQLFIVYQTYPELFKDFHIVRKER